MNDLKTMLWRTTSMLTLFAVISASLIVGSHYMTQTQIMQNEKNTLLQTLNVFIPSTQYDNDVIQDSIEMRDLEGLGSEKSQRIYRLRQGDQPIAAILNVIAPDGYSGNIYLLVAIHYDGHLAGVRVLSHKETPGLGDMIEERRSKWILGFNERSLQNPTAQGWNVKRDGGVFDQFTGATITPRAIVHAVHKALLFYQQHRDEIFTRK